MNRKKIKESIIGIGIVCISFIMFLFCIQFTIIEQPVEINDELPENSEYVTHGIYQTADGEYVTLVKTENGKELMFVSEKEFHVMMKYDVDFLTAKEMLR